MANVHRWGADDWIDHNREVGEREEDGRLGGKVKFQKGVRRWGRGAEACRDLLRAS